MNGKTPLEKLKSYKSLINPDVVNFPVLVIEDVFNLSKIAFLNLQHFSSISIFNFTGSLTHQAAESSFFELLINVIFNNG